jgi:hypothetical protein
VTGKSDKYTAMWWPNLYRGAPEPSEWASLCLWYDQITLTTTASTIARAEGSSMLIASYPEAFPRSQRLCLDSEGRPTFVELPTRALAVFVDAVSRLSRAGVIVPLASPKPLSGDFPDLDFPEPSVYAIVKTRRSSLGKDRLRALQYWCGVREVMVALMASQDSGLPLILDGTPRTRRLGSCSSAEQLSDVLGTTAISQLALPRIGTTHVDDLLEARDRLKDELLEFRAGVLSLTWLLYQQVKNKNDLNEVRQEADVLVNTTIKAAVMSLETRMRQHENKRIRRMLLATGRVLVEAAKMFLPSTWQERLIAGGKTLVQTATEIDSVKPPEHQVAAYLCKLKRQLEP